MSRSLRIAVLAVVFASVLSVAGLAHAAPVRFETVDITLHSEESGGVMVISGDLPAATALPAQVELSAPTGAPLIWIGEILGGPIAEDPQLEYTKTTPKGADVYRGTLTQARTAQLEVETAGAQSTDGVNYTVSLAWPSSFDVAEAVLIVRVPASAQITQESTGATLYPSDASYAFYSKTVKNVKAGDKLEMAFSYSAAPVSAQPAAAAPVSGSDTVVLLVLVLGLVAGIVLIVVAVAVRGTTRPRAQAADDDDEATSAPEQRDAPDVRDEQQIVPKRRGSKKRTLITGGIIAVFLLIAVIVGVETTKPRVTGDTISQTFTTADPCATTVIALSVPAGSDPVANAQKLFAVLKGVASVTNATYSISGSTVEVGYCESQTSPDALRTALAPTGLVASAATTGTPAP
jgi:hypothetical protein